jgi:hypothetical protein
VVKDGGFMNSEIYISEREAEIMSYLYQLRVLTIEQIYQKWWKGNSSNKPVGTLRTCRDSIRRFMSRTNYITMFKPPLASALCYVQLTPQGVKALRYFPISFIGTRKRPFLRSDIIPLSRLTLHPRLFSHQTALNQFVLDFEELDLPVSWTYYDEKFVSKILPGVRPDGILHVENTYYFLEMDMDTERDRALKTKWEHYRSFLNSPTFYRMAGEIRVLFITECYSPQARANHVRTLAFDSLFDKFNGRFDMFFGAPDEMSSIIKQYIYENELMELSTIPYVSSLEQHGFVAKIRNDYGDMFADLSFAIYIKSLHNEFFVCDFRNMSSSVIHDIFDWAGTTLRIKQATNKRIPYLLVCESLEHSFYTLKNVGVDLDVDNIFFTTTDRLKMLQFHKALARIDSIGNVYEFTDETLSDSVYRDNIKTYS